MDLGFRVEPNDPSKPAFRATSTSTIVPPATIRGVRANGQHQAGWVKLAVGLVGEGRLQSLVGCQSIKRKRLYISVSRYVNR